MAIALWREVRQIKDPEIRSGLIQRLAQTMAGMYRGQIAGATTGERMESVTRMLGERNVPFAVDRTGQLPVLTALACPYPQLAEQDRSICAVEKILFSKLLGEKVRLTECRLDRREQLLPLRNQWNDRYSERFGIGRSALNDTTEEKIMTEPWIEGRFEENFAITTVEQAINWARQSSIWPMTFGLACCAIEMMAAGASRFDMDRFGAGAFRATPRQADLMIVAGTVTYKMASRVRRLYNLMPDPKFVIAMGACTVGGGPYFKYGYHVVKGVDLVVPVDVYVPGCPPRPEALLEGLMRIQDKIKGHHIARQAAATAGVKVDDELPVPHHSGYVDVEERAAAVRSPENHG